MMSEMQKQELLTAVRVHFITRYDDGLERIYETVQACERAGEEMVGEWGCSQVL
jgi:hypothetical protein